MGSRMLLTIPTSDRLEYAVPTKTPVWVKRRLIYTCRCHEQFDGISGLLGLDQIRASGLTETEGVAEESGFHLFIGRKSAYVGIMDELNRTIEQMWSDGTIQRILDKYGA